jgi:hypothetical protein
VVKSFFSMNVLYCIVLYCGFHPSIITCIEISKLFEIGVQIWINLFVTTKGKCSWKHMEKHSLLGIVQFMGTFWHSDTCNKYHELFNYGKYIKKAELYKALEHFGICINELTWKQQGWCNWDFTIREIVSPQYRLETSHT